MQITRVNRLLLLLAAAGLALATYWTLARRSEGPYTIPESTLASWTLVVSDGTDPWVVAAKPPDALTRSLFQTASSRAGRPLVAPAHAALPLVLRGEFDDALQGSFGVDSIVRLAGDAGLETGQPFQPICVAHRTVDGDEGPAELYFVPFESSGFNQLRASLLPDHPEQSGIGEYDPAMLTPILVIGATENAFARWWPLRFDRERDCESAVSTAVTGAR